MKFNTQILILVLLLCLSSGVCLASDVFNTQPFTAFALDSKLGTRSLANQSSVTMAASQALQPRKSPNEAFLYSLVIPGMGQLYTGAKRGYIYIAAEAGFLAAYFTLRNSAANTRDDYRDVVRDHVKFIGAGSFEDWDPIEDFEHATQYETWNHDYDSEATRNRTGKWYWADLNPDLKNENHRDLEERGLGSKYRLEAFELRQEANDTFERAKFFLGLAILNHVVSAVEARITTKRFNTRLQNPISQARTRTFDIDVRADLSTGGLTSALVLRKRF
ncbi:hypothetical protein F4Z99_19695 [Candidatus Poribacteria bacterium]|nr:hypothetical protein [Candidatus Poribacteria bacterium]MYA99085.1 hypothetical protein [Candidatus Poribacteria bacterium]